MKKIKTFEDACKILKMDTTLPNVSMIRESNRESIIARYKLEIIAEALNYDSKTKKAWIPDWNNWDEFKYYPWFYLNEPGFRFGDSYIVGTNSSVSSRLCYRTRALSDYAGSQFIDLYKVMMTIPK